MNKWETVRLGDILEYEQPTKYIVKSTQYNNSFATPVLTAGQTFILGYTDETDNIYRENLPCIIFDDFTTAVKYVDFPFKVKSSAMKILKADRKIASIKYLYYLMTTIKSDTELHKRYWISQYSNIEIPLPPLPVQKQIADTLDKASRLIDLRKQQLEKMDLLVKSKFIEMFGDEENFTKELLSENVVEMFIGPFGSSLKNDCFVDFENSYCMVYEQKHAIRKTMDVETRYVSEKKYRELKRFSVYPNDIIVSCRGTIGETFIVPDNAPMGIMHPSIMKIRLSQKSYNIIFFEELLKQCLQKHKYKAEGSGIKMAITASELGGQLFPVPPLPLQTEFASFVERVEAQKSLMLHSLSKMEMNYKALMQEYFG